jgi:hypothetical protein
MGRPKKPPKKIKRLEKPATTEYQREQANEIGGVRVSKAEARRREKDKKKKDDDADTEKG